MKKKMILYAVRAHAPEIPPKPSAGKSGGWVLGGFAILQARRCLSRARGRRKGEREEGTNPSERGAREGGVEEGRISSVRGTSSRRRAPRIQHIRTLAYLKAPVRDASDSTSLSLSRVTWLRR